MLITKGFIGRTRRVFTYIGAAVVAVALLTAGCSDDNDDDSNEVDDVGSQCTNGVVGVCGDYTDPDPSFTAIEKRQWNLIENTGANGCTEATGKANTAAIQRALDSLARAGVKNIRLEKGEYCVWGANGWESLSYNSTAVKVPSNVNFDLGGSTLKLVPNDRERSEILVLENVSNTKIFNGHLIGDRRSHNYNATQGAGTHEWGIGIGMAGSRNIELYDLEIHEVTGDNIGITGSANDGSRGSKNITIRNCRISKGRRGGITIVQADTVKIYNNEIFGIYDDILENENIGAEACITFEGFGYGDKFAMIENVEIYNNILRGNREFKEGRGAVFNPHTGSRNIVLRNNEIRGGIEMRYGYNILFKNNRFSEGEFYPDGSQCDDPEKPWANSGNIIFEDNTFENYMLITTGGLPFIEYRWPCHTHKQNFAYINNTFYADHFIGNVLHSTKAAFIDNKFITTRGTITGFNVVIEKQEEPKDVNMIYWVNNDIPQIYDQDREIGYLWPRKYTIMDYPKNGDYREYKLSGTDIINTRDHPQIPHDKYKESDNRAEAEAWIRSWRTLY